MNPFDDRTGWRLRGAAMVALVCFATLPALTAAAQEAEKRMAAALSGFAGQPIAIESIKPSPAPGISEVQIENGPMLYATDDGAYFFLNGDLHRADGADAINLTEERRSVGRREQMATVSVDDMVVFSPEGETLDYVSVFTDVTCFTVRSCIERSINSMRRNRGALSGLSPRRHRLRRCKEACHGMVRRRPTNHAYRVEGRC